MHLSIWSGSYPGGMASIIRPALLAAGVLAAGVAMPVAAAEPVQSYAGQPADAVIQDLEAQGYDVSINYLNGNAKGLSRCRVAGVNDPNSSPPAPGVFTTVYVDVECSNHNDGDSGGGFGFGGTIG